MASRPGDVAKMIDCKRFCWTNELKLARHLEFKCMALGGTRPHERKRDSGEAAAVRIDYFNKSLLLTINSAAAPPVA